MILGPSPHGNAVNLASTGRLERDRWMQMTAVRDWTPRLAGLSEAGATIFCTVRGAGNTGVSVKGYAT